MELNHDAFVDIWQNELGTMWITKIFHDGCGSYFLNYASYESDEEQIIPIPWKEGSDKINKLIELLLEKD